MFHVSFWGSGIWKMSSLKVGSSCCWSSTVFLTSCYSFPLQEKKNSNKDKVTLYYFLQATLEVDTVQSLGKKWHVSHIKRHNHTVTEISLEKTILKYLCFTILLAFASGKTFRCWWWHNFLWGLWKYHSPRHMWLSRAICRCFTKCRWGKKWYTKMSQKYFSSIQKDL